MSHLFRGIGLNGYRILGYDNNQKVVIRAVAEAQCPPPELAHPELQEQRSRHLRTRNPGCDPSGSRSEILLRPNHLKAIARAAVPMRTRHAADDVETLVANAQRLAINQFLAHVHAFHQADDESILADLH